MDPRIADLKRRIYAAAARHGYTAKQFEASVALYRSGLAWREFTIRLGATYDEFARACRVAGEAFRALGARLQ